MSSPLFPDFGSFSSGNPLLDYLSGFEGNTQGAQSLPEPQSTSFPSKEEDRKKVSGDKKRKKRKRKLLARAQQQVPQAQQAQQAQQNRGLTTGGLTTGGLTTGGLTTGGLTTGGLTTGKVGESSISKDSPMAPYRGLGRNPNSRIGQGG
jgi:hypothetical protein